MSRPFDVTEYNNLLEMDRKGSQQMVADSLLDPEDADFRDWMREDEILEMFDD